MAETSLSIIDKFLNAPDSVDRQKGLHALAHFDSTAAAERLLEAALSDPDGAVRDKAEAIVARAAAEPAMAELLQTRFDTASDHTRMYSFLGRLRLRGAKLSLRYGNWISRLRDSIRLVNGFRRGRGAQYFFRGFLPGMFGNIFGMIVMTGLLSLLDLNDANGIVYGSLFFGPVVFVLALWSAPTLIYVDRLAAILSEALLSALLLALLLPFLFPFLLSQPTMFDTGIVPILLLPFAAAVSVAAIRITAGAVCGCMGLGFFNMLVGTLVAGCAGLLASMVVFGTLFADATNFGIFNKMVSLLWGISFPLAATYIWLDRLPNEYRILAASPSSRSSTLPGGWPQPNFSQRTAFRTIGLVVICMFLMIYLALPIKYYDPNTNATVNGKEHAIGTAPVQWSSNARTPKFTISLVYDGKLTVRAKPRQTDGFSYRLVLFPKDSRALPIPVTEKSDNGEIFLTTNILTAGSYDLILESDINAGEDQHQLSSILTRTGIRFGASPGPSPGYEYDVSLTFAAKEGG